MNWDLIFAIIFYGLLLIFFLRNRNKFEIQAKIIAIYRTKIGLRLMDWIGKKFRSFLFYFGYFSIFISFLAMFFIFFTLVVKTYQFLVVPNATPALAPVFPGVPIPGLPTIGFWHWIIAIFILALIHEFSHGIYARVHNVRVKSSGLAFFGPILGAFVEPDEERMEKKGKMAQLSILSAGSFSNLLLGIIVFVLFLFLINPISAGFYVSEGVVVIGVEEGLPVELVGMKEGELIKSINGIEIKNVDDFKDNLDNLKPGDKLDIITDVSNYEIIAVESPNEQGKGYLGILVNAQNVEIKEDLKEKYGSWPFKLFMWFQLLIYWIFLTNIGVGLFNLLPIGPLDGGKMFYLMNLAIFKKKKLAKNIWVFVSIFILLLIIINLLPLLTKLVMFLVKPFSLLISLFF